jgi:hypothetical protein
MPEGRPYVFPISVGATAAQIDVLELLAGTGKPLKLVGLELGQTSEVGDAQEEQLLLVWKYATGSVTSGSGGGTSTGRPCYPNDAATAATIEVGNTTKLAVGTGTVVELGRQAWNIRQEKFVLPPEVARQVCDAGARLVLELAKTPADSIDAIVGMGWYVELI